MYSSLRRVPLLQRLTESDLLKLTGGFEEVVYPNGKFVFHQGQRGTEFFLIKSVWIIMLDVPDVLDVLDVFEWFMCLMCLSA